MATIKINELPTSSINSTDFLVKADGNGLATKNTIENLLSSVADLNGNSSELFEVSNGLSGNDAVNVTQLDIIENELFDKIQDEEGDRQSADTILQENIDAEVITRSDADISLQSNIDLKVNISSIVNNVTAGGVGVPLSAEQGKLLKAEILALAGSLIPQGNWDADTNDPDISGTTETGYFWIVSVDGSTDIGGITDWKVNDWVIKTADGFAKIDNTDKVLSVAGKIGEVVLAKADVGLSNVDNTTDANKPISTAQQTALDLKLNKNNSITGATKTKITYDAKGLVTSGEDATTNDIAESTNKKYVTDAQLTILGNTSNTNSGDNAVNSSSATSAQGDLADSASQATDVEDNATADQTGAEIKTAYEAETNAYTDSKNTKLDGIEDNADVTNATNVEDSGALMDSEITNLAQVKAFDSSDYATSANLNLKANKASPVFTGDATFGGVISNIKNVYGEFIIKKERTDGSQLMGLKESSDGTAKLAIVTNNIERYVIDSSGNHDFKSGNSTFGGDVIIDGGTGVDSSALLHIRQKGDSAADGIAITSSNAASSRIWKDAAGVLNLTTAGGVGLGIDNLGNATFGGLVELESNAPSLNVTRTATNDKGQLSLTCENDLNTIYSTDGVLSGKDFAIRQGTSIVYKILANGNHDFQNGDATFGGSVQADSYKSSDGTVGLTTTFTISGTSYTYKNGILTGVFSA